MKKFQHFTESSIVDIDIFDEAKVRYVLKAKNQSMIFDMRDSGEVKDL